MTEAAALYRLMSWLSPSFPVGSYAYSHGLEWAVEAGTVCNGDSLIEWLRTILRHGGGHSDAIFFTHAFHAAAASEVDRLREVAELAGAFAISAERRLETTQQGSAFAAAVAASWPAPGLSLHEWLEDLPLALPIAVAIAAASHGIALEAALGAYLHGFVANLVSAGVRLVPLGQTDGQRTLAALEPVVAATVREAMTTPLDSVGGAAFLSDIAAMHHETQYTRLFRS